MIPMPIMEALIKAGILGAVLAWALIENTKDKDRLFRVVENNTRALEMIKQDSCKETCFELAKLDTVRVRQYVR